ncbi:DUF4433 domain-containing protein [Microbacterium sp. PAMC22086]|uniref:type II toxin-antitoxin system toxin DNA ADP-ribosyl transferase DarT n=1 Tax=Microbacterium sp. PAMC22086 TaxID=2861281 RepID=UPI001C62CE7A|nr:DUF4433 domain-containing protein [Microbacterium sp. PAMC22086]QYG12081.1 DUF4433 domain-containing protein [Microbacterium sp. PAMC22086]
MVERKQPTIVYHFTHVDHLSTIVEHGLLSDASAAAGSLLTTEVGNRGIKDQRRRCAVPVPPGGFVADYVPFYFAPRSPMMFAIASGNVPSYLGGTARLIYFVTTLERLEAAGCQPVLTDRNAALNYAEYRVFDLGDPIDDGFVDWDLMRARYWANTDAEPERRERRMAEALAYDRVPWEAIGAVRTQNETVADEVREVLAGFGSTVPVDVRAPWYF